jgi:hypothetical protein
VQEPYEGCFIRPACRSTGGTRRPLSETPRRRRAAAARLRFAKREGGTGARASVRRLPSNPGRGEAQGSSRRSTHSSCVGREGLPAGLKPRSRGPLGRPTASAAGKPTGETARGSFRPETRRIPAERRRLRRAKSHERRRCERKPAGARREQAAERVTKP